MIGAPLSIWWRYGDPLSSFFASFAPTLVVYYPLLAVGVEQSKDGKPAADQRLDRQRDLVHLGLLAAAQGRALLELSRSHNPPTIAAAGYASTG